jgi:hypothetical protein
MKKIFKSKIDNLILALTLLPILFSLIFFINKGGLLPIVVILLVAVFLLSILFSTNYIILNETLLVKSSFLVNLKIDINSIKKIVKSRSWEKAPANSMDRIEVSYNKYDTVIISPENKDEFIKTLLNINPKIEVNI